MFSLSYSLRKLSLRQSRGGSLKYFNVVYEVGDIIESGGFILAPWHRERYAKEGFANQAPSRCDVKEMTMLSGLPRGQAARKTL